MNLFDFLTDLRLGLVRWDVATPLAFWLGLGGILFTITIWSRDARR